MTPIDCLIKEGKRHSITIDPVDHCIKTDSSLKAHIGDEQKHEKYDRVLADMGMDITFFKKLREKPNFIFSTQPGPWLTANFKAIVALLNNLIENYDCNRGLSGTYALMNDRFTFTGLKKAFNEFTLANGLKTLHLTEKRFIEHHEGLAYSNTIMEEKTTQRILSIFNLGAELTKASQKSLHEFEDFIHHCPHDKKENAIRIDDLIPHEINVSKLYESLRQIFTEKAVVDLESICKNSNPQEDWGKFWTTVNSKILKTEIGKADDLLNDFVLAVEDVEKLADRLASYTNHDRTKPISLVNIIDSESGQHACVQYSFDKTSSAQESGLSYNIRNHQTHSYENKPITWEKVREMAKKRLTAGPSYTLKYFLRAAANTYFLVDSTLSVKETKHDAEISILHEKLIGIPYPWVSLRQNPNKSPSDEVPPIDTFISLYSPHHHIEQNKAIAEFFAG